MSGRQKGNDGNRIELGCRQPFDSMHNDSVDQPPLHVNHWAEYSRGPQQLTDSAQQENPNRQLGVVLCAMCLLRNPRSVSAAKKVPMLGAE
jgi:hypothetical protein